ncbi:MAG: 2-C-methyl-D-erythritol 2,4-cyclodiphosphate synthase [Parvibaculales bacterium]
MVNQLKTVALIVAAGRGVRAGGMDIPKQYRILPDGRTVLTRTLSVFDQHPEIDAVLSVIHADDREHYDAASALITKALPPVIGGVTRQDSVRNGLEALTNLAPDQILVHDAARPFVSTRLISDVIKALDSSACALPVIDVTDTIKHIISQNLDGVRLTTPPRDQLKSAQTPQGFRFAEFLQAHRQAGSGLTDDAALMEDGDIALVQGEAANIKLTTPEDFETMAATRYETRTGTGYDVHAFCAGAEIRLGGISIPHTKALAGHSDADVVLHALTDAVLGSQALGDIGDHFPPSEATNKNRDSAEFLAHAVELTAKSGGRITHLDVTIICEAPKILPHRDAMRARIADICGISPDRVSVKGTTTEKLGFTGREEGIAVQATASVEVAVKDA